MLSGNKSSRSFPARWQVPAAGSPLNLNIVELPSSKSQLARLLILGALAAILNLESVEIKNFTLCTDTRVLLKGLKALGAAFTIQKIPSSAHSNTHFLSSTDALIRYNLRFNAANSSLPSTYLTWPWITESTQPLNSNLDNPAHINYPFKSSKSTPPLRIDCDQAGTARRFLPALATVLSDKTNFQFTVASNAIHRPQTELDKAIDSLNSQLQEIKKDPSHWPATRYLSLQVNAQLSSQFLSALLIIAPALPRPLRLQTISDYPSAPHVQMTLDTLSNFGANYHPKHIRNASRLNTEFLIYPGLRPPKVLSVEPDLTNAGPYIAASLITTGEVQFPALTIPTNQPGKIWPTFLKQFHLDNNLLAFPQNRRNSLDGTSPYKSPIMTNPSDSNWLVIDLKNHGELLPVLAAVALFASHPTRFENVAHIRGHECDRLNALTEAVHAIGGQAQNGDTYLEIWPLSHSRSSIFSNSEHATDNRTNPPSTLEIKTYNDHRLVMFAAIVGIHIQPLWVDNAACVAKTMPHFCAHWENWLKTCQSLYHSSIL